MIDYGIVQTSATSLKPGGDDVLLALN